jgi:undecaprenyl phosphate N,N'-diacetylbacillosamine 1-phosphate transferase
MSAPLSEPMAAVRPDDRPGIGRGYALMKRMVDVVLSFLMMALLLPVGCACALAVCLTSPGPAIYTTRRLGRNGKAFTLYKFRSMYVGAPDWRNSDGSSFNSDKDLRVTPVGRFLRHASWDELPQLLNVLLGDMSLVGPRPDQEDQLRYYTESEKAKLSVKPGITGLAQISGRNSIAWEVRKALDLEYVKRQSILLDLVILCKTITYVLKREGVNSSTTTSQEV